MAIHPTRRHAWLHRPRCLEGQRPRILQQLAQECQNAHREGNREGEQNADSFQVQDESRQVRSRPGRLRSSARRQQLGPRLQGDLDGQPLTDRHAEGTLQLDEEADVQDQVWTEQDVHERVATVS